MQLSKRKIKLNLKSSPTQKMTPSPPNRPGYFPLLNTEIFQFL